MKRNVREPFKLGWMDFGLSALASCLAVYSIGMGLRVPEVSWFFCGWIATGTVISFVVSRVMPERHTWVSGILYSVMAISSVAYAPSLNAILPKGGFPIQLIIAASLAWMLVFGSFLTWRDSTIVFQAVPSIALFGLVGAWDTFAGAPFAFFGFLLCFATLFARAHGRVMILQAEESGYQPLAAPTPRESATTVYELLKRGPWRWMAGPEWALGSAAVIVLLSVLGAPVFQTSVQGVAGFVQINVPTAAATIGTAASAFSPAPSGNVNVGQGPRGNLTMREIFKIKLSYSGTKRPVPPQYLRMRTYADYTGRGWRPVQDFANPELMLEARRSDKSFMNLARQEMDPYYRVEFTLEMTDAPADGIPIPGEIDFLSGSQSLINRPDGTLRYPEVGARPAIINGWSRIGVPDALPTDAKKEGLPPVYSTPVSSPDDSGRVRALTLNVVKGAKSDYEKALAIKRAIGERVTYDLQAPGVPAGSDPVDWFLFDGKSGYCDLFASAMTVMARHAGLPARYVVGYYPALGQRDRDRRWILHESEAHAWCEIYFEKAGWVVFDATEGARELGQPTADVPMLERAWFRAAVFTVGGLAVVFVPIAIAGFVRKRRMPGDPMRAEVGRQYQRFVRGMERATGKPKRPSQTPEEYLQAVLPLLPRGAKEAEQLTARFVGDLYAPPDPDPARLGSLKGEVAAALRALRGK